MAFQLGPLRPQPQDQSHLGSLIVDLVREVVRMADRQGLIVKSIDGKRQGTERIIEELELVLQALAQEYFAGNRTGMLKNEHHLAEIADIGSDNARLLVDQCWPILNRLLFTLLVHEGILPRPVLQRLLTWTGRVNGNPDASWQYADDRVLTPLVHTALIPGVAEVLLDGVAWQFFDHGGRLHRRVAKRLGSTGRRRLIEPEEAAQALFEEIHAFRDIQERSPLSGCDALSRSVPLGADVWGIGPPDRKTGQPTGHRRAPGDLPGVLRRATELELPALMVSMVAGGGEHTGSLDASEVFVDNGLVKLKGDTLLDHLLEMRSPMNKIFEDIYLHDEYRRAEQADIPSGTRYVNSRGHLIIGGAPQCMLVRMTVTGEPMVFVHNMYPTEAAKTVLVSSAEALVRCQYDSATSSCLSRSFLEIGAPFSVKGPSNGARFGMFGLGCAFNMLLIAAVRSHEMDLMSPS